MESDLLSFADSMFWAGVVLGAICMFVVLVVLELFLDRKVCK